MKTNKNVKGFTLVELIVVIAIIGVLAAILVPSMLGYVKKANQAAANSNAKTIYNAAATAVTDLDTKGIKAPTTAITYDDSDAIAKLGASKDVTKDTASADAFGAFFKDSLGNIGNITNVKIGFNSGAVTATICKKGSYAGSYPKASQQGDTPAIDDSTGALTGATATD